jgi:hypothetical protein
MLWMYACIHVCMYVCLRAGIDVCTHIYVSIKSVDSEEVFCLWVVGTLRIYLIFVTPNSCPPSYCFSCLPFGKIYVHMSYAYMYNQGCQKYYYHSFFFSYPPFTLPPEQPHTHTHIHLQVRVQGPLEITKYDKFWGEGDTPTKDASFSLPFGELEFLLDANKRKQEHGRRSL